MTTEPEQWICRECRRPLDDHQLVNPHGGWLSAPMCVPEGAIKDGTRFGVKGDTR